MSANDRQVGGDHYRVPYQHWDLISDLGSGYFEGQITKYVSRHYKKNKLQDLEKAEHFCAKLTELSHADYPPIGHVPTQEQMDKFSEFNGLGEAEYEIVRRALSWTRTADLLDIGILIKKLIAKEYPSFNKRGGDVRVHAAPAPVQPRFTATGREKVFTTRNPNAVQHKSTMGRGDAHERMPGGHGHGATPDDMQQFGESKVGKPADDLPDDYEVN